MKFQIFSMRDELSGYLTPTFELNESIAIRNFSYAINRKDTLYYANAKHFDLYHIGSFDTDTGVIEKVEPTIVVTGVSVIQE